MLKQRRKVYSSLIKEIFTLNQECLRSLDQEGSGCTQSKSKKAYTQLFSVYVKVQTALLNVDQRNTKFIFKKKKRNQVNLFIQDQEAKNFIIESINNYHKTTWNVTNTPPDP